MQNPLTDKRFPIKGIDVSHWQGDINFRILSLEIQFVYAKATEGSTWRDDRFEVYRETCNRPFGAYHLLSMTSEPERQVDAFLREVTDLEVEPELIPMLDVEHKAVTEVLPGFARDCVFRWLNTYKEITKQKAIFYVSARGMRAMKADWSDFKDQVHGYWWADYKLQSYQKGKPRTVNASDWFLWQVTSHQRMPGIQSKVDLNYLNPDYGLDRLRILSKGDTQFHPTPCLCGMGGWVEIEDRPFWACSHCRRVRYME